MKIKTQLPTVLNRSLLALTLGCALASLPVAVRAQSGDTTATTQAPAVQPEASPVTQTTVESTAGKKLPATTAAEHFSESDKVIARKFANGNEGEVEMGKLALTNAENQDIKDFAQKMIDDHGAANKELVDIANAHGMDLKPEVDAAERAMYLKAKQLKGTNFDGMYAKNAVADHTDDVKEYKKDMPKIKDPALKAYAEKTLPIIEGHLKMADELKGAASAGGEAKAAKKAKQS